MKIYKLLLPIFLFNLIGKSAEINVTNINQSFDNVYALADSTGSLLSSSLTNVAKIGYFSSLSDASIEAAWLSGDVVSLANDFVTFDSTFGMETTLGFDGIINASPSTLSDSFEPNHIYLWLTTVSNGFSSSSAEHFIYKFNLTFQAEPWDPDGILLGTSSGTLLVGGFDNFSFDLFGAGPLPAFNTVEAVPEPSTYAAIVGLLALAIVGFRRFRS